MHIVQRSLLVALSLFILGGFPLALPAAADDCAAIGGSIVAGKCQVSGAQTFAGGTLAFSETVRCLAGASITLTDDTVFNITGNLEMDTGCSIGRRITSNGHRPDITVNAAGSIIMAAKAELVSDQTAGSCNSAVSGGDLSLAAGTAVTQAGTASIETISPCGRGAIAITAPTISLGGKTLSQGTSTIGQGGPITVTASRTRFRGFSETISWAARRAAH